MGAVMTFTTRDGRRYEVLSSGTWTTGTGQTVTHHRIAMDNPETGHGWGGVISDAELTELLSQRVRA